MVCLEGREEEETRRAIGLKKCVKKSQDARGNEPAKRWVSPRDHEPGDQRNSSKENELEGSKTNEHCAAIQKEKRGENFKGSRGEDTPNTRRFCFKGQVEAATGGQAQTSNHDIVMKKYYDELWPSPADSSYHCPTGCPPELTVFDSETMFSSHGGPKGSGSSGLPPQEDGNRNYDGPWCQAKFLYPPAVKSQDQWNYVRYGSKEYWVKVHHMARVRAFHPIHRSQPFDAEMIGHQRVTVRFFNGEYSKPQRIFDKWTEGEEAHERRPKGEDRWIGYTFFEVDQEKKDQRDEQKVPQSFRGEGY